MQKIIIVVALAMSVFAGSAQAVTITETNPYEFSSRTTNWDQNYESESGSVSKSGSYFNYDVGGVVPWNKGTWLFSGYVQMTFTVPADMLFIQFQADTNDGIAQFVVDGTAVGSVNTFNKGWFQVEISGLTLGLHTLRVNRITADLAFDNFGASASTVSPVPIPAIFPIFAAVMGLFGFVGWRRRRRAAAVA